VLGRVALAGRARLHADALAGEGRQRREALALGGAHDEGLVGVEVRVGEVGRLVPLGRDGHGGGGDVAAPVVEVVEQPVEGAVDHDEVELAVRRDLPEQVEVVPGVLAVGRLDLEGLVGQVGADREGAVAHQLRRDGRVGGVVATGGRQEHRGHDDAEGVHAAP